MRAALAALATLGGTVVLLTAPAAAEPPTGGSFRPGVTLAAVELGMSRADVLATWGERHGVCRGCPQRTWYFNERPFNPQGAGVVFERGRVVHAFTVWQPEGWETPEGLALGDAAGAIGETYGELEEVDCGDYVALIREHPTARSAFYVYEDEVWGFGLLRAGRSACL